MQTLAVVGAGPKGIAIAAKARALAAAGLEPPRVVLLERTAVAASWTGRQGYTNGSLALGTPPEKDVGYPYAQSWGAMSGPVTTAMADFSWQRYLIDRAAYADWVDRGRLRPTHREWSDYLSNVAARCAAEVVHDELIALDIDGARWRLRLADGGVLEADGVVLTGAGPPAEVPGQPHGHPRVLDGRSYWLHEGELGKVAHNICVIGGGETAASIVVNLVARGHRHSTVDVVTTNGVLYSRGESYNENRFYSDPGEWPLLAESHRREFIRRTDRGVVSSQAEAALNASRCLRVLPGRAVGFKAGEQHVVATIEYGDERERIAYDWVIVAAGFNARWFERALGGEARHRFAEALAGDELDRRISIDLSVSDLEPALHLPILAGLAQGPGFPNLSCLGLLSDRVLSRYVPLARAGARPEEEPEEEKQLA
jgi:mycobactin lysine-N-oxygenase